MIPVKYLLDYVKEQVGKPYWFGTYGQILNSAIWRDNAKRYPRYYSNVRKEVARQRGDYGKKGHDCSGLIKGARWTYPHDFNMPAKYVASEDMDANTMIKSCKESGSINNVPEIAGLVVWKNNHIGVYIGGGQVIEAKGFDYGVVKSRLEDTKWSKWGKLPFVDYEVSEEVKPEPVVEKPVGEDQDVYTVKKGDTLTKIAKMWGVSVDEIASYNGIKNVNLIQIGQRIRKPKKEEKEDGSVWVGMVNTIKDPLNIRSGAGKGFVVVGQLPKGSLVKINGEAISGWYKLADGRGYVSANLIKRA